MQATFYGVRGSFPSATAASSRYGGNTSAVTVQLDGQHEPLLLDLGTGVHRFGLTQARDGSFRGHALVTHLHFDHVIGLPFFSPLHSPGSRLDVYAPTQQVGSVADAFERLIRPPYFPVGVGELGGDIRFHDVCFDQLTIGGAKVTVRPVPHVGPTVGYRIEAGGRVLTYISDHQGSSGLDCIDQEVLELCDGADLLVHDSQFTPEEFAQMPDWGHCTIEYALLVAREAGVRRLCLFHHDPSRRDDDIDRLLASARRQAAGVGIEVVAAAEGLTVSV